MNRPIALLCGGGGLLFASLAPKSVNLAPRDDLLFAYSATFSAWLCAHLRDSAFAFPFESLAILLKPLKNFGQLRHVKCAGGGGALRLVALPLPQNQMIFKIPNKILRMSYPQNIFQSKSLGDR